jgi:hypothetical protein
MASSSLLGPTLAYEEAAAERAPLLPSGSSVSSAKRSSSLSSESSTDDGSTIDIEAAIPEATEAAQKPQHAAPAGTGTKITTVVVILLIGEFGQLPYNNYSSDKNNKAPSSRMQTVHWFLQLTQRSRLNSTTSKTRVGSSQGLL